MAQDSCARSPKLAYDGKSFASGKMFHGLLREALKNGEMDRPSVLYVQARPLTEGENMGPEEKELNDLAGQLTKLNAGKERVPIGQVRETLRLMKELEMSELAKKPGVRNAPSAIIHRAARAALKKKE